MGNSPGRQWVREGAWPPWILISRYFSPTTQLHPTWRPSATRASSPHCPPSPTPACTTPAPSPTPQRPSRRASASACQPWARPRATTRTCHRLTRARRRHRVARSRPARHPTTCTTVLRPAPTSSPWWAASGRRHASCRPAPTRPPARRCSTPASRTRAMWWRPRAATATPPPTWRPPRALRRPCGGPTEWGCARAIRAAGRRPGSARRGPSVALWRSPRGPHGGCSPPANCLRSPSLASEVRTVRRRCGPVSDFFLLTWRNLRVSASAHCGHVVKANRKIPRGKLWMLLI